MSEQKEEATLDEVILSAGDYEGHLRSYVNHGPNGFEVRDGINGMLLLRLRPGDRRWSLFNKHHGYWQLMGIAPPPRFEPGRADVEEVNPWTGEPVPEGWR
jgi:hypothetical protein